MWRKTSYFVFFDTPSLLFTRKNWTKLNQMSYKIVDAKKNVRIRKLLFLNHPVRFVSSALQNFLRFFWLGRFTRCIRKHSKYNTRLYVILVIINCDGNENSEQQNLLRFYVITMRYKSIKYTWMHTVGLWHQYVFQEFNFATNCKYYLWNWSSILIL